MKAFLVAVALVLSLACSSAHANQVPGLPDPPPATAPTIVPIPPHVAGLDQLMKQLMEDAPKDAPKLVCKKHPCAQGYRLAGKIDDDSAETFEGFMQAAEAAHADIILIELNTLGGSLRAAHEISRLIEHSPARVVCLVDGDAVSAGMYILASCDTRVMTKRSDLMVHQVALMSSEGSRVTESTVENQQGMMRVSTRQYLEWVVHRMKGVTYPSILARTANDREWWMDWQEALKIGAVDKVVDGPPEVYFSQLQKTGKP